MGACNCIDNYVCRWFMEKVLASTGMEWSCSASVDAFDLLGRHRSLVLVMYRSTPYIICCCVLSEKKQYKDFIIGLPAGCAGQALFTFKLESEILSYTYSRLFLALSALK